MKLSLGYLSLVLVACSGPPDQTGSPLHSVPPLGPVTPQDGGSDALSSEAGPDVGPDVGDASPGQDGGSSVCQSLGGPCSSPDDCYCGLGAGCEWDNVVCSSGRCAVGQVPLPPVDAGYPAPIPCCTSCEAAWESGGTLGDYQSCVQTCGQAACPVVCLK